MTNSRHLSSAYDKLKRILVLEKRQECRDRTVFGGLTRFLGYWEKEAREEEGRHLISVTEIMSALDDYEEMPLEERSEAVTRILDELQRDEQAREIEPDAPFRAAPPKPAAAEAPAEVAQEESEESPDPEPAPVAPPARRASAPPEAPDGQTLHSPVSTIKGVGPANEKRLARLGIHTVRDLLYHFPRRYDDFSCPKQINDLEYGQEVTIVGSVRDVQLQRTRSGKSLVKAAVSDGTASIEVTWFNQPFLEKRLRPGREIVISGKVDEYLGRLVFTSPEWEPLQRQLLHTGRLVPVYPLTKGTRARWMRRLIHRTLETWVPRIIDPLPPRMIESACLVDLGTALEQIHFPDSQGLLTKARQRLAFDEFLLLQLGILAHRRLWQGQRARALEIPHDEVRGFLEALPFELTAAQHRALEEILGDMARPQPMSRLLQGDVGSGKTVVAALTAVRNGLQVAIMAPTSILAEQHYRTFGQLLGQDDGESAKAWSSSPVRCELLVGSLPPMEKARIQEELGAGRVHVVVGTHALIQDAVDFGRLGLVVVDEQHRFGVEQRGTLRAKGGEVQPHLLTMSATPIPRTLALTIYGDLDISVIDELPPGRQQVLTAVRDHRSRERIYSFIKAQIAEGRQAFIICPLVKESDVIEARSAVEEHERLQREVFRRHRLGLLHGRLKDDEKEEVMAAFKAGEYDILVSTAVVEVGIDIPNATVMLIEGAERFGLAQLHQFRGRVGRGAHKSYCILLADDPSPESLERLMTMEQTNDGFVLAEKDLEMRGAGDFFGSRQHGLPELKVASLGDMDTLQLARQEALALFDDDPTLSQPEHRLLGLAVRRFWDAPDLS